MSEEELYNMSTDEEENDSQKVELDGDTDDEIFRHQAKQRELERLA